MLFGLGQLLSKCKLLRFIGRNTLFIFLAHQAIYDGLIYIINGLCKQQLCGQSMPLNGWSIGISLMTLAIATVLAWGFQTVKKRIVKK